MRRVNELTLFECSFINALFVERRVKHESRWSAVNQISAPNLIGFFINIVALFITQEKLLEAQENRRMLQNKLSDIKSQLEAVHDDIMNTPRNDRYLELIKRDLQVKIAGSRKFWIIYFHKLFETIASSQWHRYHRKIQMGWKLWTWFIYSFNGCCEIVPWEGASLCNDHQILVGSCIDHWYDGNYCKSMSCSYFICPHRNYVRSTSHNVELPLPKQQLHNA